MILSGRIEINTGGDGAKVDDNKRKYYIHGTLYTDSLDASCIMAGELETHINHKDDTMSIGINYDMPVQDKRGEGNEIYFSIRTDDIKKYLKFFESRKWIDKEPYETFTQYKI